MRISKTWRNSTILNIPMIKPKLHYYDLGSGVVAFSSTRHGGVGTDTHASFSINKYCGDDVDAIALNRFQAYVQRNNPPPNRKCR